MFGPLACEDKWAWYGQMFCCAFTNHSRVMPATVNIEDLAHPSMAGLPAHWQRSDEWYNFTGTPRGCARVLATVDESTYSGGTMGSDHPIVWCRRVGEGRMWYTAMGHAPEAFDEPLFRKHLLGGILCVAGKASADFSPNPTVAAGLAWNRAADAVRLLENGQVVWQFNGLNYWEDNPATGRGDGLTVWQKPRIETGDDFSARIVMDLDYQPPAGAPVMREHRLIEVSPPDQHGTYHLDWVLTFTAADNDVLLDRTPLPGEPGGQSWGGYAGLSVRFTGAMRQIQTFTSRGPIEFTNGAYRGRALAMDYSGVIDNREAGIAILDCPSNLNSPSPWYAIINGAMSYFSPAILCYRPFLLKARQSLSLRYRVLVHEGRWDREQLHLASQQYAEHN